MVRVSIITPTGNRDGYLQWQYHNICQQTYASWEWLILDNSEQPSAFFLSLTDPRVKYFYFPQAMTVGAKRNLLVQAASGQVIVHFDDDDFYAAHYLAQAVESLKTVDLVKLESWYLYAPEHDFWGYFDADSTHVWAYALHILADRNQPIDQTRRFQLDETMRWGYGFSYAYRRTLWESNPFPDRSFGEDHDWILSRLRGKGYRLLRVQDTQGLAVHLCHSASSSHAFPQHRLTEAEVPTHLVAGCRYWQPIRLQAETAPLALS
ncbi:MAG: glycosyltransferase family A protein [Candidatus Melainabacteria bacterium]|nr:glycosyltransferase family A protein [Candidatus Melainabacteria bacterium]